MADHHLPLTAREARALLALAAKGRVLLDVDPRFLPRREDRAAGRAAVARLRAALNPPVHLVARPAAAAESQPA